MAIPRIAAALAALFLAAPALAAAPDRSSLSFEDNVTINTACYAARAKGEGAFQDCVKAQIAAVAAHPAPNRTTLGADRAREIEDGCAYLRRVGVAEYNDCLRKSVTAAPAPSDADDKDEGLASSSSLSKALTEKDEPAVVPVVAATLPLPSKVLHARPSNIARTAMPPAELFKKVQRSIFIVGAARSIG